MDSDSYTLDLMHVEREVNRKEIFYQRCPKEHKILKVLNERGKSRIIPTHLEGQFVLQEI